MPAIELRKALIENIKMTRSAINQKFPQHGFNDDLDVDNSHTYCCWPQTSILRGHNLNQWFSKCGAQKCKYWMHPRPIESETLEVSWCIRINKPSRRFWCLLKFELLKLHVLNPTVCFSFCTFFVLFLNYIYWGDIG